MSKVLITGISSFTGGYVARCLISKGFDVFGTVGRNNKATTESIKGISGVFTCMLNHREVLDEILSKVRPDYVIHLAAISFVDHADQAEMYRVNVLGTECLMQSIQKNLPNVKRVIVASSANVYGNQGRVQVDEGFNLSPCNHYAYSKVAMEYMLNVFKADLPIVITRPFNYTGVGQNINFLIPKIISSIKSKSSSIDLGNLNISRDISDVRDIASIYAQLLIEPEVKAAEVYNLCAGKAYRLVDIIGLAMSLSNHQLSIQVNEDLVRSNEIDYLCGSREKLNKTLALPENIKLEDTLRWMLRPTEL